MNNDQYLAWTLQDKASKKELKQVKQYLENIDTSKVEKVFGKGRYEEWHGDNKSGSGTDIVFQTKSLETSKKPHVYITIVAKKGRSEAYVTYESKSWDDVSAKTIIDDFIAALTKHGI